VTAYRSIRKQREAMPIPMQCACGKSLKVKDEAAGRKVRCPGCAAILPVPKPEAPKEADDEALEFLLAEGRPRAKSSSAPAAPPAHKAEAEERFTVKAPPARPKPAPLEKKPPKQKRYPREDRASQDGWRMPSIVVNPSIISGLAMMGGAVVWFVVGLYAGWVFFYPPILFVLGIGAVIRGFTGRED
jgi:hypothetical protein